MNNPFETILEYLHRLEKKVDRIELKTKEPTPQLYTVKEFSELTDSSEQTVRLWIKKGLIKGEKLGRKIYINESQFQEGLQEVKSLKFKR